MTVDEVIQKAYLHANRKAIPPATGTTKYNALLGIVDSVQKDWAAEPGVDWNSLFSLVTLGAVVTATDTFALGSTIQTVSKLEGDYIRVTNGTTTYDYRIVKPNQLYQFQYDDAVAQIGSNLKFSQAFTADSPQLGYSIKVPAYLYPADLDSGSDTVQVDDPMWVAYMAAFEFVRVDLLKQNTKTDLLEKANEHMLKMKENNGSTYDVVPTVYDPGNWTTWGPEL